MRVTAAVTVEGNVLVAQCLEVDVASQGATEAEAVSNLAEALALHFQDQPVPTNMRAPVIVPVDVRFPPTPERMTR